MLGSPAGPGGGSHHQRGLWPLAPAPPSVASDAFGKCGVYSLFPGGPAFGSALYSHRTIGQFTSGHLQPTSANPFYHKDSLFASTGYTFGAPTPPPGSPYSPVPVAQLELLAKGFNSNIIIHHQSAAADFPPSPTKRMRCDEKCCSGLSRHTKAACDCPSVKNGGCSRTNPIEWNGVHVKKEPCQVAEITTSDVVAPHAVIKLEVTSPKNGSEGHHVAGIHNDYIGNIPAVGIAVARQRYQQEVIGSPSLPPAGLLTTVNAVKEVTKTSETAECTTTGMAASGHGGVAGGGTLLQCADERNASLAGWPVGGAHNSALTTPTLWQCPAPVPVEPILPVHSMIPPVGFQLVRDPTTGGLLLLPTTGIEPLQQTVVWPSYHHQSTAPSVLLPPLPPPPLQLLGSASAASADYLSSSTTLHQHTQTHSTRLLAVSTTSDSKRKQPLPLPATTLIKIETDATKTLQAVSTIGGAGGGNAGGVFSTEQPLLTTHLIYQHPSLIVSQPTHHQETICRSSLGHHYYRSQGTSPVTCLTPPPEVPLAVDEEPTSVQDASNQTENEEYTPLTITEIVEKKIDDTFEKKSLENLAKNSAEHAKDEAQNVKDEEQNVKDQVQNVQDEVQNLKVHNVKDEVLHFKDKVQVVKNEAQDINNGAKSSRCEIAQNQDHDVAKPCGNFTNERESAKNDAQYVKNQAHYVKYEGQYVKKEPDLSGLELLSSIVEFESKNEEVKENNGQELGGLDLLCALAEQRIMEAENDEKNRKAERKLKRKSKHHHRRSHDEPERKKNKRKLSEDTMEPDVKQAECWPEMNDMELDMRMKLADLQRQYRQKRKELNKLKPGKERKRSSPQPEVPLPKLDEVQEPLPEIPQPSILKPPVLCAFENNIKPHQLPMKQSDRIINDYKKDLLRQELLARTSSKKRKVGRPKKLHAAFGFNQSNTETIVAKKPKTSNFVNYLLAAKEKFKARKTYQDTVPLVKTKKTKNNNEVVSKIRPKLKAEPTLKTCIEDDEDQDDEMKEFSLQNYRDLSSDEEMEEARLEPAFVEDQREVAAVDQSFEVDQVQEIDDMGDLEDDLDSERDDEAIGEVPIKKPEDMRCLLTGEHLEMDKLRVLTAMGGLFYAGNLNAVQPPDVYSITLDGERGNRPHIMSREEILRDAIVEVPVKSVDELTPGTRLCAYWSQQYRCLYPGSVAEPGTPDPVLDSKFVAVEFDDGDSGRIAIDDIRLLPPDYPIIEYDPNPLLSLSKRKRRTSASISTDERNSAVVAPKQPIKSSQPSDVIEKENKDLSNTIIMTTDSQNNNCNSNNNSNNNSKERKRLKKKKRDKQRREQVASVSVDSVDVAVKEVDEVEETSVKRKRKKHRCLDSEHCRHRKHHKKHHRKHRKHHHHIETVEDGAAVKGNGVLAVVPEEEEEEEMQGFEEGMSEVTLNDIVQSECVNNNNNNNNVSKNKKIRDRQESCESRSKMSAFLPARQLWSWSGKGYKRFRVKGKSRKIFYRSIQRGKETVTVGDSAVFLSTGRPDRPYIGKIQAMWELCGTMVVKVNWFYHPEETVGCPANLKYPGALFESPHFDENDVQTISHRCEVLPLAAYCDRLGDNPQNYAAIYENNDIYYLAGYYDPTSATIKMEESIPFNSNDEQ